MSQNINDVTPKLASAYIKNSADALSQLFADIEMNKKTAVDEIIRTLLRTSLHLDPSAYGINSEISDLKSESSMVQETEAKAASLYDALSSNHSKKSGRAFAELDLLTYLQEHPMGGKKTRILSARLLAGGRSKQTILLKVNNANELPNDVVVRRDWASSVTGTSVVSEFELLKTLYQQGLKVPEPLLLESDSDALGSPFILMSRVEGKALGDPFTPPASNDLVYALATELGKLHNLDTTLFENLAGVHEENTDHADLREKLKNYRTIIDQFGVSSTIVNAALSWLDQNIDHVEINKGLVHADLGFHNLLCEDDSLSAILDWELAHIGHPALDLGYLRSVVTQRVEWQDFLAAYYRAGGVVQSDLTINFFTLFASIWLYQLLLQARAAVESKAINDMEVTHVCAHFLPALIARISNELTYTDSNNT